MKALAPITPSKRYITLKAAVKTRWWSEVTMLNSFFANKEILEAMERLGKAPALVKKLEWSKMEIMTTVLRPFADAVKILEGDKYLTGGLVASTICYLCKALFKVLEHEDDAMKGAGAAALADFDHRYDSMNISGCTKRGTLKREVTCPGFAPIPPPHLSPTSSSLKRNAYLSEHRAGYILRFFF